MSSAEEIGTTEATVSQGALCLLVGQASLVLGGYIVNIGLGHLLGPTEFGRFATITSLMVLLETVFLIGIPMALGKHIAETGGGDRALIHRLGWVQLVYSGFLLLALFGMAKLLAGLLNDPGLAEYIRVVAWGIPASAALQLYTRILNGLAAFGRQAAAIVLFSVLRLAFTFGFVALGAGAAGALWALVLATALASLIAAMLDGARGRGQMEGVSWQELLGLAVRFAVFTGAVRFLNTADQLFVKALVQEGSQAGFYAAAGLFGKVPHFVAFAMSAAVFPLVARSAALRARGDVVQNVTQAVRGLAILLLPLVALATVLGLSLVTTFFGEQYGPAAQVLWALILGSMLVGLFRILATAVAAIGGLRSAVLASLLMGLLDGILCLALIPWVGILGAAIAMIITALTGCLVMLRYITREFGAVIVLRSWARAILSSIMIGVLAYPLRGLTGVWLLIACAGLYFTHFGVLIMLGEVGATEIVSMLSALPIAGLGESLGDNLRRLRG